MSDDPQQYSAVHVCPFLAISVIPTGRRNILFYVFEKDCCIYNIKPGYTKQTSTKRIEKI